MSEAFTAEFIIRLISSAIGTAAFSVIFNVRVRHLPYACVCGTVTYAIYYVCVFFESSVFAAAFLAAAFTAVFAELCARLRRAPASVFLIPGVIPIVPGGDLYNSMRCLLSQDIGGAYGYMSAALKIGIGIAGGIVAVSVIFGLVWGMLTRKKNSLTEIFKKV